MDTDVQMLEQTEAQTGPQTEAQQAAPQGALSDALDDPLAEGSDSVQMAVPPKPGAGPKVTDRVGTVDEVAAES